MRTLVYLAVALFSVNATGTALVTAEKVAKEKWHALKPIAPGESRSFLNKEWPNQTGRECFLHSFPDDTWEARCRGLLSIGGRVRDLPRNKKITLVVKKNKNNIESVGLEY